MRKFLQLSYASSLNAGVAGFFEVKQDSFLPMPIDYEKNGLFVGKGVKEICCKVSLRITAEMLSCHACSDDKLRGKLAVITNRIVTDYVPAVARKIAKNILLCGWTLNKKNVNLKINLYQSEGFEVYVPSNWGWNTRKWSSDAKKALEKLTGILVSAFTTNSFENIELTAKMRVSEGQSIITDYDDYDGSGEGKVYRVRMQGTESGGVSRFTVKRALFHVDDLALGEDALPQYLPSQRALDSIIDKVVNNVELDDKSCTLLTAFLLKGFVVTR